MKQIAILVLTALVCAGPVQAMMRIDGGPETSRTVSTAPVRQGGTVDAIYAGASKLVIGGVTYAYNPLTTVVTMNGKRSTISDLRVGDRVQFQAASQGERQPSLLTSISVQTR